MPPDNEHPVVNIGPSHPAMHGTFRVQALMDGETIQDCEAEIGYMHRNFEKMAEVRTYWQIIPYTDRLNYCSSFMNGHGWALAVEKLLGVPAPPRAEAIRVILSEFSRIMDHFICIGTNVVDLGRDHALLRALPRPRGHLRPAGGLLRGAAHRVLRAHRRPRRRRPRGLRRPLPQGHGEHRARSPTRRTSSSPATRSSPAASRTWACCPPRTRSPTAGWAPACAAPAWPTTSARTIPTPATSSTTSTCPWAPPATATTATSCAWRRSGRACASSSRRCAKLPDGPGASWTTSGWPCPRSRRSTATSKP